MKTVPFLSFVLSAWIIAPTAAFAGDGCEGCGGGAKVDAPAAGQPAADDPAAPKADTPKTDEPKVDAPKTDTPAPASAETETVKGAIAKVASYPSYAFKSDTQTEGMGGGRGGRGEGEPRQGEPPAEPPAEPRPGEGDRPRRGGFGGGPVEGKYAKDTGLWIATQTVELIKIGDAAAYLGPEDVEWKKVEAPPQNQPPGQGQGRQPGQGRGRGFRDPSRMLARLKAPHEELAVVAGGITKTESVEKEGETTKYTVALSPQLVLELSRFGRRFAEQGGDMALTGTATIWVDATGNVTKYEIATSLKAVLPDRDVDMKSKTAVEITGIGATTVEIPEDARKAIQGGGEKKEGEAKEPTPL